MSTDRKPNVILMLIDDMGYKDVGFMGSAYYETPNMDRLARQGMVFDNAYATPNCAPTRATLMSGLYSPRHGIYTVGSPERGPAHLRKLVPPLNETVLDRKFTTIAEMLKPAGYVCGHVGKWHLGEGELTGPEGRGFDLNAGGTHHGHPPAGYFSPYKISALEDGPDNEYLTDRLTMEALKFIEDCARGEVGDTAGVGSGAAGANNGAEAGTGTGADGVRPFFLYFAHYAVHKPLQAKPDMIAKYERKSPSDGQGNPIYAAMIESTDESVGRIVAKLDELGLADNTVLFFISDNGGLGGYGAEGIRSEDVTSQAPLRGGKGMFYEGGIRVPMLVRWPGVVEPGTLCETPVSVVDFFPTIQEAAGIAGGQAAQRLDGESLMPLLKRTGGLRRNALFWHHPGYLEGGKGTWRMTPGAAIRQGDWKLIETFEIGQLELYHLPTDIGERHNLADERPEVTRELHRIMLEWRRDVQAPMPLGPNLQYDPSQS
jgi:arylsulfatase A-like enzyme